MADIVILGGGFGGLATAAALKPAAERGHRIQLLDRRAEFMMGLRKLWILAGKASRAEGSRPLEAVRRHGASFSLEEVVAIEPDRKVVRTARRSLSYDFLVVSVGAELRPDLVPGSEHAVNLYDVAEVERAAQRLARWEEGRVLVGILGVPYKCPPAPYEAVLLLDGLFRERGVRGRVELGMFTPQPVSLPVAGPEACALLEAELDSRQIRFEPNHKVSRVEPGRVFFEGDPAQAWDLLLAVPPHRPPRLLAESGLAAEGEWIRPDPATLRTRWDGLFAIGDAIEIGLANRMALPKAGVFAEAQGKVVAAEILHELGLGPEPAGFDGAGFCFIETGEGRAAYVRGEFFAPGGPRVELSEPDSATLESKREFERARLEAWL
jgi:sulfide:quinone oxidoreductase